MTTHPLGRLSLAPGHRTSEPWWLAAGPFALIGAVSFALNAAWPGVGHQRWAILIIAAPILEEALFRAGVQETMLRRGTPALAANVLTAIAFAAAHAVAQADGSALLVALPALWIGWIFERTRQVRWCVVSHAALNAVWLAFVAGRVL